MQLDPEVALPVERFGGLVRDGEAGLDYAQARSYQVRTGRFSTTDPLFAGLYTPQRWNRYAYARSSPASFVDPSGLTDQRAHPTGMIVANGQYVHVSALIYDIGLRGMGTGSGDDGGMLIISDLGDLDSGAIGAGTGTTNQNPWQNPGQNPGWGQDPDPTNGNDNANPNPLVEFAKGCAQGAAGFIDGVIPFGDPFESIGAYDRVDPAAWWSQPIGEGVRNFATVELGAGVVLGRVAGFLASAAKGGNSLAQTVSSGNRYVRLGLSNMGGRGKTPALRIGNAQTEWGRWGSHVDLRISQVTSQTAPTGVIKFQRYCRLR